MISSTSCSSRLLRCSAVFSLALSLSGCVSGGQRVGDLPAPLDAGGHYRLALFPIDNESGARAFARTLGEELRNVLSAAGMELVSDEELNRFLARHRIRYVSGVDQEVAKAARNDLGVKGILIPSVEQQDLAPVPRIELTMRLVSTDDEPQVLWMGGIGSAGDEAPGLLGLGIVSDSRKLEDREFGRLATSLSEYLGGRGSRSRPCPAEARFRPNILFRAEDLETAIPHSVVVFPFVNESDRRNAGTVVALEFLRQLSSVDNLRVVEPGVVRDRLLKLRIVLEGGVSLDTARVMLAQTDADLVLAGYVHEYADPPAGTSSAPRVSFTVFMLERRNQKVIWQASSHHEGNDRVFFFGAGSVGTAIGLTCRMARNAIDSLMAADGKTRTDGNRSHATP